MWGCSLPSHCRVFQGHPFLCDSTKAARCFAIRVFAAKDHQLHICQDPPVDLPASRPSPSLPTATQDALHSPQTKRSFPSFIHPHFEAATASIAGGLLAYVESLYVERRVRKDGSDDGRYSAVAGRRGAGEGE